MPIFERFFLGDEFTIRGYNVRSISPIAPLDTFILHRRMCHLLKMPLAPMAMPGVPSTLANIGVFTGHLAATPVRLPAVIHAVGGDTQILANFEYRIPIIGNSSGVAAFADIGTAFNFVPKVTRFSRAPLSLTIHSYKPWGSLPCPRLPSGFTPTTLTTLAACNANSQLALTGNLGLVMRDNRLVTTQELDNAQNLGPFNPKYGLPLWFPGGVPARRTQTDTVVRLSQSLYDKLGDFRSSLGMEVRVQVPILNVPFRLIFAYNPNARENQVIQGFPFFFNEKKKVIRFSVGRTF